MVNLKHPLLLICLSQFCIAFGMGLTGPILPIYASSFQISYAMVGIVLSSFGIIRVFIEIPGGILADRFGLKPIILLGYSLSAASHLLAGFAQTFVVLMISRMIIGIGSALLMNASMIYVGEIATADRRAKYIALFQSTFSIADFVGPALGGFISEIFSIRAIFFVSTIVTLIGTILVLSMKVHREAFNFDRRARIGVDVLQVIKNVRIIALCASCFIMFFVYSSIRATMIPLYGVRELNLSATQIGLVFSFTSIVNVITLLFLTHRFEKFLKSLLLSFSMLLCSISVCLISLASDFITLSLFSIPLGMGFAFLQPTPFAMLIDYTKPENRGLVMGVLRTVGDFGLILGPMIVGYLIDLDQTPLAFYIVAGIVGLFSFLTWRVFRKSKNIRNSVP